MQGAEASAPTRPHPYAPHTGVAGQVSRRVMHAVDAFWDATEGRMVPEKERRDRGKPGRFTQYFLADPRFDEDEPPEGQVRLGPWQGLPAPPPSVGRM